MAQTHSDNPGFGIDEEVIMERPVTPLEQAIKDVGQRDTRPWSVTEVAEWADENGVHRFTDEDAVRTNSLTNAAIYYAEHYTGSFGYLVSMKRRLRRGGSLSAPMVRGILNCMLAEARRVRESARKATVERDIVPSPKPEQPAPEVALEGAAMLKNGTYTIVSDEGHITLRIRDYNDAYGRPTGKRVAEALVGPDNSTDFLAFATFTPEYVKPWGAKATTRRMVALMRLLRGEADSEDAGYKYALRSGRCFVCGRKLTVPASIHRGMGPICAAKR